MPVAGGGDGLTRLNKKEGIEQAIALVRKAKTYRQIAAELGVSLGTAHGWVQEGLKAIPMAEATELRREQAERLEYLHEKLMERLESPTFIEAFDAEGEPIRIASSTTWRRPSRPRASSANPSGSCTDSMHRNRFRVRCPWTTRSMA